MYVLHIFAEEQRKFQKRNACDRVGKAELDVALAIHLYHLTYTYCALITSLR